MQAAPIGVEDTAAASTRRARPLFDRLPAELQAELRLLEKDGEGLLRRRAIDPLFADHLGVLLRLKQGGVTDRDLAALLAELGILGSDGEALPRGTISAAISRARAAEQPARGPNLSSDTTHTSGPPMPPSTAPSSWTAAPAPAAPRTAPRPLATGGANPRDPPRIRAPDQRLSNLLYQTEDDR